MSTDGRWLKANRSLCELLGYLSDELVPSTLQARTHPDDIDRDLVLVRQMLAGERQTYQVERRYQHRNGEMVWVLLAVSLVRNRQGEPLYFIGQMQDLSQQKRAEDALGVSNSRLRESVAALERRSEEIRIIGEMSELLHTCRSLDEACEVVSKYAHRLFPDFGGALHLFDGAHKVLEPIAVWGHHTRQSFLPDACWALRRGRVHVVDTPADEVICQHVQPIPPAHSVCVPLIAQNEELGVLHLSSPEPATAQGVRVESESQRDITRHLVTSVAERVALAISNLRMQETLRAQAIRDPLTGLYNRRFMEDALARELHRARRNRAPLGVVMLDMDWFKAVNDTHGHAAGDLVLVEVGRVLREAVRIDDVACRYGGDEFALVLPNISAELARDRVASIIHKLAQVRVKHGGGELAGLTLSAGIAMYPENGTTPEDLLRRADRALYEAKSAGRNRVTSAPVAKPDP